MLACALNPSSNNVEVIDTYNVGYSNIRDTKQVSTKPLYYPLAQFKPYSTPQNMCQHFSNYTNGRISCRYVLPLTEPLLHHDVDTFLCSLQQVSAELLIQGMSKTRTSTSHTIYCMEHQTSLIVSNGINTESLLCTTALSQNHTLTSSLENSCQQRFHQIILP